MKKAFMSPYLAGFGLGLTLLAAYLLYGKGLGTTGAMMRTVVAAEKVVSERHVERNPYLVNYGGKESNPLENWLVFEVIGMVIGAALSGIISGRFRKEINHGKRITPNQRLFYSFIGGGLFSYGARIARGCTSGVALSGGATLSLGSWVIMICIFASAFVAAYFVRKLWI